MTSLQDTRVNSSRRRSTSQHRARAGCALRSISARCCFYGAVYGVLGALMLYYNDFAPLPFMEKVGMVIPFVLGPPVIAGLGWLQLLLLGWIARVLGDMA